MAAIIRGSGDDMTRFARNRFCNRLPIETDLMRANLDITAVVETVQRMCRRGVFFYFRGRSYNWFQTLDPNRSREALFRNPRVELKEGEAGALPVMVTMARSSIFVIKKVEPICVKTSGRVFSKKLHAFLNLSTRNQTSIRAGMCQAGVLDEAM
jgi:hypothetical protein